MTRRTATPPVLGAFDVDTAHGQIGWGALAGTIIAVGLPLSGYVLWRASQRLSPAGQAKGAAIDARLALAAPRAKFATVMVPAFAQAAPADPCAASRAALDDATRTLATMGLSSRGFNGAGPATYLGTALQWSSLADADRLRWLANAFRFRGTGAAFGLIAPEWTRQLHAELVRLNTLVATLISLRNQAALLLSVGGCRT